MPERTSERGYSHSKTIRLALGFAAAVVATPACGTPPPVSQEVGANQIDSVVSQIKALEERYKVERLSIDVARDVLVPLYFDLYAHYSGSDLDKDEVLSSIIFDAPPSEDPLKTLTGALGIDVENRRFTNIWFDLSKTPSNQVLSFPNETTIIYGIDTFRTGVIHEFTHRDTVIRSNPRIGQVLKEHWDPRVIPETFISVGFGGIVSRENVPISAPGSRDPDDLRKFEELAADTIGCEIGIKAGFPYRYGSYYRNASKIRLLLNQYGVSTDEFSDLRRQANLEGIAIRLATVSKNKRNEAIRSSDELLSFGLDIASAIILPSWSRWNEAAGHRGVEDFFPDLGYIKDISNKHLCLPAPDLFPKR